MRRTLNHPLALMMFVTMLLGVSFPVLQAEESAKGEQAEAVDAADQQQAGATADQLLELERRIAIQKRMLELRKLQLQQQEQELKLFGATPSKTGEPVVIQMPKMSLLSLHSKNGEVVAALRYGARSMRVRKGELIEDGVRIIDVNADGVRIDFHGSQISLAIERGRSDSMSGARQ